ncbi:MAG: DUF4013 domain-containing protein [Anaerolineales bacterium]
MDFGAAFSFVTADEDWVKKLAIASVIALVGVLTAGLAMIPLAGWVLAITRRVREGTEPVLPEWTDFGQLVMDGLKIVAITIVWTLPIILLSACVGLISALVSSGQGNSEMLPAFANVLLSCVSIPYGLVVSLFLPAAYGHLAATDNLGQALNPAVAFKVLRENVGGYVINALVWLFLVPIIESIGLLICVIGVFPAIAYTSAVMGHLMGQAYRGAEEAGFQLEPAA